MSEVLNANPTIRSAADLPSRRREPSKKAKSQRPFGLLSSAIPDSAYTPDPFNPSSSSESESSEDENEVEPIDEQEIYDLIASIQDPEHPLTLGSLSVVNLPDISLTPTLPPPSSSLSNQPTTSAPVMTTVTVLVTPTITHCSLATVIGLGVRVRLEQALPPRFRVDVRIKEGTHSTAEQVNRQLGDKERVAAALENGTLMGVLRKMLEGC
ncbi:MAG: hypothetical protein LQ348_000638 [Seirophora lacunosa]|nr:MAG: hypothetical protein LQ344_004486 [Seirophora lacunosa]KAI4207253.1 MAG: hypothetical protein LQ348_000638 [Seirophora lacunosa]